MPSASIQATNGVVAVAVLWNGGSPAATRLVIQAKYWDSTDALVVAGMIAKYKAWANSCGIRVGSLTVRWSRRALDPVIGA